jgi:uncharacterized protein YkwD
MSRLVSLTLVLLACPTPAPTDADSTGSTTGQGSETGGPDSGSSTTDDPTELSAVCDRWTADRADLREGTWTGSVATCDPGDISPDARENALRLVNLYRWLADLPPVDHDPVKNAAAQECAVLMHANNALSHTPPPQWTCYSEEGADAAGASSIATLPGVAAVDLYMTDPGNATTLGHRRWILGNWLGTIGLGSTSGYSCMYVFGEGVGSAPWTAWPPAGPVPLEAFGLWGDLDATGWSVQSDTVDLTDVTVTVARDGQALPVTVTPLLDYYGSLSAISFVPSGWQTVPGAYQVTIAGASVPIDYLVEVVDCAAR